MNHLFPKNCTECPVWKKSLFKDFSQDLINWLASKKQEHELAKKDYLFHQGQEVKGIFCHMEGLVRVVQNDAKGNIRFTRLVLPGDTSGHRSIFIEDNYKGTADVISDNLKACFITKSDILFLLSNNVSFAKNLVIKISRELHRSEEEVISLKERDVRSRLAFLLYELCREHSEKISESQYVIKSEVTKKDIASLLLVANETVIRLMSEMKSEGVIRYQGKRIVISDLEEIRKLSRLDGYSQPGL